MGVFSVQRAGFDQTFVRVELVRIASISSISSQRRVLVLA